MSVIAVDRVIKRYGDVVAVSDVSFNLNGGVTGLLGPNGAGKTTLLKMMAGLLSPSSGSVRVLGKSLRQKTSLYRRIGFCPENDPAYGYMTGLEFLQITARLENMPAHKEAATRALKAVDLEAQADKKIRAYSRGMRQRLKVAQSILHDPDVILLDEPLKGADPNQRKILIDLVVKFGQQGRTVVVSSHILHEVERMASQIVLINRGRLLALGDFHSIREAMSDRPHKVALRANNIHRLAAVLTENQLVSGIDLNNDELIADVNQPQAFYGRLPQLALESGIRLTKIASLDADLESVFRYLVAS